MMDQNINPVYINLNEDLTTSASDTSLSFHDIFKTEGSKEELEFLFESPYAPYSEYALDKLDHIDLVIKKSGNYVRPLEVKLTVLPDNATETKKDQSMWGTELVIRPDSTSYASLGIYHSLKHKAKEIKELLEPVAEAINNWENEVEIGQHRDQIIGILDIFQRQYFSFQEPFLLQPIWKTQGKSPELSENAFDIFVWSDMALCRLIINQERKESKRRSTQKIQKNTKRIPVSRYLRASARLLRCLYELFSKEKTNIGRIFRGMQLGNQTDKECSLNGSVTNSYMKHPRLLNPCLKKEVLRHIILGGGEKILSPERRFDASIFFTARHLFEIEPADEVNQDN